MYKNIFMYKIKISLHPYKTKINNNNVSNVMLIFWQNYVQILGESAILSSS